MAANSHTTPSQNLIGVNVAKLRVKSGLTQDELATKCNVLGWDISRATLSKIEYGIRRVNDAEVYLFTQVLECSPADLFCGVDGAQALKGARHGRAN